MSDPLSSVTKARSQLARLHMGGVTPDAEMLNLHRANLACAKIDNRIRDYSADVTFNEGHVAHLVGLILMQSGVGGEAVQLIERLARDAVANARQANR